MMYGPVRPTGAAAATNATKPLGMKRSQRGVSSQGFYLQQDFLGGGWKEDHFLSWWRELLLNDANALILPGLREGPASCCTKVHQRLKKALGQRAADAGAGSQAWSTNVVRTRGWGGHWRCLLRGEKRGCLPLVGRLPPPGHI
ncbi:hypothetical protein Cadr_000009079 [Camelus dromedarius]|uniref:Uncharacterized protein n=1 Tax=Camelus dromedarius TaxID=9838 RepID=A0A5N4DIX8_CAMDR|nr:hypothetical protein Cadr_000009079 [Camelus dromedarius]